jgi:hypothetical protein
VLKSLGVNAGRSGWKLGVYDSHINQLPEKVRKEIQGADTTITKYNGYSSSTYKPPMSQKDYTKSMGPKYPALDAAASETRKMGLVSSFSSKDSQFKFKGATINTLEEEQEAKFYMLCQTIRKELNGLEATLVHPSQTNSYSYDDYSGCIFCLSLKVSENSTPLVGWTIIGEKDVVELQTMTGMNGLAVMKIPFSHIASGKPMSFTAYDPADRLGPYKFSFQPVKGRVMEVALSLPFRKKDETGTENKGEHVNGLSKDIDGGQINDSYTSRPLSGWVHGADKKSDIRLLSQQTQASNNGSTTGMSSESVHNEPSSLEPIPETSPGVAFSSIAWDKFFINRKDKTEMSVFLTWLLNRGSAGQYLNWKPIPTIEAFMDKMYKDEPYTQLYLSRCGHKMKSATHLTKDAIRLAGWERFELKANYKIEVYITLLLHTFPSRYIKEGHYMSTKPFFIPDEFDPLLLKKTMQPTPSTTSNSQGVSSSRNVSYSYFLTLMAFVANNKTLETMTPTQLSHNMSCAVENRKSLDTLIMQLGEGILTSETSSLNAIKLRVSAIAARNYLKSEREDVNDFALQLESRLKSIQAAEEADAAMLAEGGNCCDC